MKKQLNLEGNHGVFWRIRISKANSGENDGMFGIHLSGEKHPFYGKYHTEKSKQKTSDSSPHLSGKEHPMFGRTGEFNRKLDVHHVNYDKMVCCNDVKPLFVPLCRSCHSKTLKDREYWEEFFTVSLEYLTDGQCFIPKEDKK